MWEEDKEMVAQDLGGGNVSAVGGGAQKTEHTEEGGTVSRVD